MVLMTALGIAAMTYANKNKTPGDGGGSDDSSPGLPPAKPLDPSTLRGKRPVDLLPLERTLALFEAPNATITFMDGDPAVASEWLRRRVADVVYRNPWLGGYLAKDSRGRVCLFYDETSDDVDTDIFTSFDLGAIHLTRETKYEDLGFAFAGHDVVVRCNADLIGRDQPIFRVAVIPDADLPQSRFALVISMSHVCGDGYTFHKIFKMLATDSTIETMNPTRKHLFVDKVYELCGPNEAFYVDKISRSPVWAAFAPRNETVIERKAFFIDEDWVEGQKRSWDRVARAQYAERKYAANNDNANGLASVTEDDGTGDDRIELIATIDSADNVGPVPKCDNQPRPAPRAANRMQRAGRRAQASDFKVSFASHDSAVHLTTNDIITSWFFQTIDATVGLMPYMLRNRIPSIKDSDAGNYCITIPYVKKDYGSPMFIQQSRQAGRRVHTETPLPKHSAENRYGICIDWRGVGLRKGGLLLGPNGECRQVLHLPCYQTRDLAFIPKSFSSIHLFNAGPHGEPACTVIAPDHVMRRIMESGIVKGIINESRVSGSEEDAFAEVVQESREGRRTSGYASLLDKDADKALALERMLSAISSEEGDDDDD